MAGRQGVAGMVMEKDKRITKEGGDKG